MYNRDLMRSMLLEIRWAQEDCPDSQPETRFLHEYKLYRQAHPKRRIMEAIVHAYEQVLLFN
jgi:hypothetical protein